MRGEDDPPLEPLDVWLRRDGARRQVSLSAGRWWRPLDALPHRTLLEIQANLAFFGLEADSHTRTGCRVQLWLTDDETVLAIGDDLPRVRPWGACSCGETRFRCPACRAVVCLGCEPFALTDADGDPPKCPHCNPKEPAP